MTIQEKINNVNGKIADICRRIGRNPLDINLVGVSKYADSDAVKEAVKAGLKHIAENKVQEAKKKFPGLEDIGSGVTTHLIGHLQTNKVKQALEVCDLIESVDSLRLAVEIDKQAQKLDKIADVLIQINTAREEQKFGLAPEETFSFLEEITQLRNIKINGVMTIAPFTEQKDIVRKCFADLKSIHDQIIEKYAHSQQIQMKYLSMGMTDDFEIALEEGSNMIRIGRAIFSAG
ncbi:MAG: YggS family pyridoxal phosphate-dependent enzyme [Candidatus Omnitrophica bacterium]|nr:YggS family pyridoxal phosphate-dependent enzyme [Candidatus Omnitrophota bacterium]